MFLHNGLHQPAVLSTLNVICVNPLEHAEELKRLFLAHDTPDFPEFFDRAYPSVMRSGGKSWIGLDSNGRVAAHIARFPRHFALGHERVTGGLLVDLMVAKSHRAFLPAVTLVRQMLANSQDDDVDFLYGAPNVPASAVFKTAGFTTVGTLDRFVLPVAGQRWYSDAVVRLYQAVVRIRAGDTSAELVEHAAEGFDPIPFEQPVGDAPSLRPLRPPELYGQRLTGYPSKADYWFTFHFAENSSRASAAVLVRGRSDRVAMLISLSREPSVPLSAIVPPLERVLRRHGYCRLWAVTLYGTPLARQLTRVGFVPRNERRPLMARALTESGAKALTSAATWEITDLDCDRGDTPSA